MPGTRTAPDVSVASPNWADWTIRIIDGNGKKFSATLRSYEDTATLAEIEAWVDAFQAGSNSSVYAVFKRLVWNSQPQASNALDDDFVSGSDQIVVLLKDDSDRGQDSTLLAPLGSTVVTDTTDPDVSGSTELGNFITESVGIANGGALGSGTFTAIQARLSQHKQTNSAVPA